MMFYLQRLPLPKFKAFGLYRHCGLWSVGGTIQAVGRKNILPGQKAGEICSII